MAKKKGGRNYLLNSQGQLDSVAISYMDGILKKRSCETDPVESDPDKTMAQEPANWLDHCITWILKTAQKMQLACTAFFTPGTFFYTN